ncbi:hypothetical protein EST38_g6529 [Candolleomyces aberdarensis]|uniref:Uncharacterized protein n=1 Tax=Candolleomyces aberdarensis TaxID=2316362 RepID=A0A4Q2DHL8_9AGAR|nr:hypothetical protein EST38_g6529 [Candolleomyces aberdarensis]
MLAEHKRKLFWWRQWSGPSSPTSASGPISPNYLPSKFSSNILKNRTGKKGGEAAFAMSKQGGGLAAFKAGE